ncbi:MAG: OmpH family outer membrane protein [Alphaproteobacteria bacterium]
MKKFLLGSIVAAGLLFPVIGAQASDLKIAVVDMQKVLQDSKAGKSIEGQVKSSRKEYSDFFDDMNKEINNSREQLQKQKSTLSKEEFAKKQYQYEQEWQASLQKAKKAEQLIQKAVNDSIGDVVDKGRSIVEAMAKEDGYNLVLTRQQVLVLSDNSLDLTAKVLEQLDKDLPNVSVKMPSKSSLEKLSTEEEPASKAEDGSKHGKKSK